VYISDSAVLIVVLSGMYKVSINPIIQSKIRLIVPTLNISLLTQPRGEFHNNTSKWTTSFTKFTTWATGFRYMMLSYTTLGRLAIQAHSQRHKRNTLYFHCVYAFVREPGLRSRYNDWLEAGCRGVGVRVRFPPLHVVQTGFGAHPAFYTVGTADSFPGGKAAGA
jgi:hypothetical protein